MAASGSTRRVAMPRRWEATPPFSSKRCREGGLMFRLPPHAKTWAAALIAAVLLPEIAHAEPPEVIVSEIGAERIVDLMFPEGTPFEGAPVIKWDHEPK